MEEYSYSLESLVKLVKYPLVTEKTVRLYEKNQYTFIVDRSLTKKDIKYVVEKKFNVSILKINTSVLPPRSKRVGKFSGKKALYKKALIKLKIGDSIKELLN